MRRVVSISVLCALFATMGQPFLMAARMQSEDCPLLKLKGHRCDQMMAQMHTHVANRSAGQTSLSVKSVDDGRCPPECLMSSSAKQSTAASTLYMAPLLASHLNHPTSVLRFVSVGLSSHTDRGPPALELSA
jgi:hypothetical protein